MAIMILVWLITQILLSISSYFALIGIVMGLISGATNFFTFCRKSSPEKRIKVILAHSCIGAFSLTLIFFLELMTKDERPIAHGLCVLVTIYCLVAVVLDLTHV
jgi:uncharacterized membrane protein